MKCEWKQLTEANKIQSFDHLEGDYLFVFDKLKSKEYFNNYFLQNFWVFLLSIERKNKHFNNQSDCFKMSIKI